MTELYNYNGYKQAHPPPQQTTHPLNDTPIVWDIHAGFSQLDPPETTGESDNRQQTIVKLDSETLSEVFRHSGWRTTRNKIWKAMIRTSQSIARRSAFRECGSRSYVLMSRDLPTQYRLAGSTCHDRFCIPCANSRSRTIALNVVNNLDKKQVRFVTLTLRSRDEPLAMLMDKLAKCFADLRRRKTWKHHVTGGVAFTEVKWSERGARWHPHLHMLVAGKFFELKRLKREWLHVTGDSDQVDVKMVTSHDAATKYVTKYASKPCINTFAHSERLLDEAVVAVKGRRLAVTFGTWRGVMLTPKPDEDAWINLGSFEACLTGAAKGETEALEAIQSLLPRAWQAYIDAVPRPPPPDVRETPNIGQMDFLGWTDHMHGDEG